MLLCLAAGAIMLACCLFLLEKPGCHSALTNLCLCNLWEGDDVKPAASSDYSIFTPTVCNKRLLTFTPTVCYRLASC